MVSHSPTLQVRTARSLSPGPRIEVNEELIRNRRSSTLLMATYVVVTTMIGWFFFGLVGLGGLTAAVAAVAFASASAVAAYRLSDVVLLRTSRGVAADPLEFARLHNLVEGLCVAAGLPKPGIFVIDDSAPNAFATGRSPRHASIVLTSGLLDRLTRIELEAVVAHELARVKNNDIQVATLAVTVLAPLTLLSDLLIRLAWWNGGRTGPDDRQGGAAPAAAIPGFALLAVAPVTSRLLNLVVSRRSEIVADIAAVSMTRYPPGLIGALEKMDAESTVVHAGGRATAHLWLASPLARTDAEGRLAKWNVMFDTHPSLSDRIDALREI